MGVRMDGAVPVTTQEYLPRGNGFNIVYYSTRIIHIHKVSQPVFFCLNLQPKGTLISRETMPANDLASNSL